MHSAVVYAAARFNIADLLAAGPKPVAELAAAARCNEDALYRVLRALAAAGIFPETGPRTFALSPAAEFLRSGVPGSIRDLVLWIGNSTHFQVWGELSHSVETGRPAVEHVCGKPVLEAMADRPRLQSRHDCHQLAACPCGSRSPGIGTLMDVAGGHGFVICEILDRYPKLQGILFDLESVIQGSKCGQCSQGRCRTTAGDFFEHIPRGANAYYLQHIIHDWDDAPALKILGNCRRTLEGVENGRLLVVDSVIPEGPEPHPGKVVDLEMMIMPGGRERTGREFRDLFAKAGFAITKVVPTRAADSVIEARLT